MNTKDNLISNIHKLFKKDPYINAVLESVGTEFDRIERKLILLKKEYLFSTMSLEKIEALEKELAYKTKAKTIEAKRIEIEARWKSSGKCDIELLQKIADSWQAEKTKITFIDGYINIDFIGGMNADNDLSSLLEALNITKPAHLPILLSTTEQNKASSYLGGFHSMATEENIIEKNKEIKILNKVYTSLFMEVEEYYEL